MGMDLVVMTQGSTAMTAIDPSKLNIETLKVWSDRNTTRVGWAGEPISFKTGGWFMGYKADKAQGIKGGTKFVARSNA